MPLNRGHPCTPALHWGSAGSLRDRSAAASPTNTAAELLAHCQKEKCTIAELMLKNELTWRDETTIHQQLKKIAEVMAECIHHGCTATDTILPGGLKVRRRAPGLYAKLQKNENPQLARTLFIE